MHTAFQIVQLVLAVVLIAAILLQTRGSGFSAYGSSDSSIYRTRRGFFSALTPLGSQRVGMDAQRLRHARAELVGLHQHRDQ